MTDPVISVIIPAFNEEATIGSILNGVNNVLEKIRAPYEVIVVNDGSTDKTAETAKGCNVVFVDHGKNLGKGAALRNGFIKSRGKFIVTMDADGSHRPEDIPSLLYPFLNGSDIDAAIGSRFNDEAGRNSTSKLHIVGNRIINAAILFLTGRYISDSQTGFRAFKREALGKLALSSSRYEIESELTIGMLMKGFKIREVPINCMERSKGSTRIRSFQDGFKILKAIVKAAFCY